MFTISIPAEITNRLVYKYCFFQSGDVTVDTDGTIHITSPMNFWNMDESFAFNGIVSFCFTSFYFNLVEFSWTCIRSKVSFHPLQLLQFPINLSHLGLAKRPPVTFSKNLRLLPVILNIVVFTFQCRNNFSKH